MTNEPVPISNWSLATGTKPGERYVYRDTPRNPVLMEASDGLPPALATGALPQQLASGAIVLACNLALQAWIDLIRDREKVTDVEARNQAVAALVPGVILQPSGVLAAALAQQHACVYVRAA